MYRSLRKDYDEAIDDFAPIPALFAGFAAFGLQRGGCCDQLWAMLAMATIIQVLFTLQFPFMAGDAQRLRHDVHLALPVLVVIGIMISRTHLIIPTAAAAFVLALRLVQGGCALDLLQSGHSCKGEFAFWRANFFFATWVTLGALRMWAARKPQATRLCAHAVTLLAGVVALWILFTTF